MKITKREIKQLAYEEYKKIILETTSKKEDTSGDDVKYDKIQKLYDLGQKIKQQADNSFTHLEAFLSLGLKVRDTFEFKRAVTEISRIKKLIDDMSTVINRAHEIANESGQTQPEENEGRRALPPGWSNKGWRKPIGSDSKKKEVDVKKEPEPDDAEVLNKRPDMKHAYESSAVDKSLDQEYAVENFAKKLRDHSYTELQIYNKIKERFKLTDDFIQIILKRIGFNEAHPMSTVRPVPSKKTLKDLGAVKVKPKQVKSPKKEAIVNEKIDFVKDAEGKPVRVRDRVIQKALDPKTQQYKWSMMDKYRVEKILGPNQIIVHDFNSEKDFPLNPTTLKRIGIEHLYEYGAVIVPKYDEKSVITEDVRAGSLKEAMKLLGIKYPANAFKITNIIEATATCSNCNHKKADHDKGGTYCLIPGCHCTKFEG